MKYVYFCAAACTLAVFAAAQDRPSTTSQVEPALRATATNQPTLNVVIHLTDAAGQAGDPSASSEAAFAQARKQAVLARKSVNAAVQSAVQAKLLGMGATHVRLYDFLNLIAAQIPSTALDFLAADPNVVEIFQDRQLTGNLDVSAQALGAPAFWTAGLRGNGWSVAVIDTGIDATHPAFAGGVIAGNQVFHAGAQAQAACYADEPANPDDLQGHGTHIAGIVAGRATATFPNLKGVAYEASIYNLKAAYKDCSDSRPHMVWSDLFAAIDWGVQNTPARIFNLSYTDLAPAADDTPEARVIDQAVRTYNLLLVVSAGDTGPGGPLANTPAIGQNIITVGAMDDGNSVNRTGDAVFGATGRGPTPGQRKKPDIVAPGASILSANNNWEGANADFVNMSGTSMAAAHIAGAGALLYSKQSFGQLSIKALLLNSADGIGWLADKGWGYANLNNTYVQEPNTLSGEADRPQRYFVGRLVSGVFKSTLAWNRDVAGSTSLLNNLDLLLYNRTTGAQVAASTSLIDNVEQVATATPAYYVVAVRNTADVGAARTFAIAFSHAGFVPANGPQISMTCTAPATAIIGTVFQVSCTVTNTGDLEALEVAAGADSVPSGWSLPARQRIGTLSPGASATKVFSLNAASTGPQELVFKADSASFGGTLSASSLREVNVTAVPGTVSIIGTIYRDPDNNGPLGFPVTLTGAVNRTTTTFQGSIVSWTSCCLFHFDNLPAGGNYVVNIDAPSVAYPDRGGFDVVGPARIELKNLTQTEHVVARVFWTTTANDNNPSVLRLRWPTGSGGEAMASVAENTFAATALPSDPIPSCTGERLNNTVWFRLDEADPFRQFTDTYSTQGSSFDTVMVLYQEGELGRHEIGCSDNVAVGLQSAVTITRAGHVLIMIGNRGTPRADDRLVLTITGTMSPFGP